MAARWGAAIRVQRRWRTVLAARMMRTYEELRRTSCCVVCSVECVDCVRCPNGHAWCVSCNSQMTSPNLRCPLCRDARIDASSAARAAGGCAGGGIRPLLRASRMRLACPDCKRNFLSSAYEAHRAWCPLHAFACPVGDCTEQVLARDFVDHARRHGVDAVGLSAFTVVLGRGDTLFFSVRDTLVVLTTEHGFADNFASRTLPIVLRAYYPTPTHACLHCTMHHHTLRAFYRRDDGPAQAETLHLGPIPAVVASHEHTTAVDRVPVVVPFCCLDDPHARPAALVYAPGTDRAAILESLDRNGVRPAPMNTDAFASPPTLRRYVALVTMQFSLTRDTKASIFSR